MTNNNNNNTSSLTYADRVARLDAMLAERRLIRGKWTGTDDQGRETACLLAAIAPECGERQSQTSCPADVMPMWLASLTPSMDDYGSEDAWPSMVRRYAAVARRWHELDSDAWTRLNYSARAVAIKEAMSHTDDADTIEACTQVRDLCLRRAAGHDVMHGEWRNASGVASSVASSRAAASSSAAARAAEAASWASWSSWAAAEAASSSAAAARAAAATSTAPEAAWAAATSTAPEAAWAAASSATWAATSTAAKAAWDRMTDAILSAIEKACDASIAGLHVEGD